MHPQWIQLLAILVLCLLTMGCPGSLRVHPPGKSFGDILVDRPEVYTRERLVSDRLEQDRWLREQLALTDKLVFGVQGLADIRSFEGLAASAGIEANPLLIDLQQAQLASEAAGVVREEEIADLEHRRRRLELLQQIQGLADGSGGAGAADVPVASTTTDPDGGGTPQPNPPAGGGAPQPQPPQGGGDTPDEGLDVTSRVESKSFSDLFEQAPTVAARQAATAASPIDAFRDKLAYREELRAEIIENALDDRHDLRGNTLYRMKFDATVLPESDTSAWAVVDVRIGGPYDDFDCSKAGIHGPISKVLYDWSDFITAYVNSELERRFYSQTTDEGQDLTIRSIEALRWLKDSDKERLQQAGESSEGSFDLEGNLRLLAVARDSSPEKERRRLIAESIRAEYIGRGLFDFLKILDFKDLRLDVVFAKEDSGGMPTPELLKDFCKALKRYSGAYTYAVTPKESVQRISDVASRREATQLSLALGLVLGSVGLDSLTEYARATEGIFQAIRRQPLVVGFNETASGKPDRFGWILGPRFFITPKKDNFYFRHAPMQQSLSAVLSVPSWWHGAKVTVRRYWRDEKGENQDHGRSIKYEVDLPGDPSGIAAALLRGFKRPPIPKPSGADYHLAIGSPGSLLIQGIDLWRNPAVFVGSQRADRITVLPNMEGIVAHFDRVAQPAGWSDDEMRRDERIDLWTSEGMTFVDDATLHRKKAPPTGVRKVKIEQTRLVGDAIALLEIEQGALPTAYSSLEVGVRRHLGGKDWEELDPHDIDAPKRLVRARITQKWLSDNLGSQYGEGMPLELAIRLRQNPAEPVTTHSAQRAPIYYSTQQAAAVKVAPGSSANLPVTLTLTLPPSVRQAYPDFDPTKVALMAEVKGKPEIGLEVTLSQKGDGWEAEISVHSSSATAWTEAHKTEQAIELKLVTGSADLLWKPDSVTIPKKS